MCSNKPNEKNTRNWENSSHLPEQVHFSVSHMQLLYLSTTRVNTLAYTIQTIIQITLLQRETKHTKSPGLDVTNLLLIICTQNCGYLSFFIVLFVLYHIPGLQIVSNGIRL